MEEIKRSMDSINDFFYLGAKSKNCAFYMEWYDHERNYHEMVFTNKTLCYQKNRYVTIMMGPRSEWYIPAYDIVKLVVNDHVYIDQRKKRIKYESLSLPREKD
jgi:hypothetical protein